VVEHGHTGGDVDAEDVDALDPGVHPGQHAAGHRRQRLDGEHPRTRSHRGQVDGRLRDVPHPPVEVDAVQVPVLVPVGVLQVEQPPRVVGPVVGGDPAAGVVGDRDGVVVGLVHAADPDVAPPPVRREVGDPGAVRGDRGDGERRLGEELLHRDHGLNCHDWTSPYAAVGDTR
jgi:hypothetical protein